MIMSGSCHICKGVFPGKTTTATRTGRTDPMGVSMWECLGSDPITIIFVCFSQIDHDICSNYGNWLYSAGLGNDPRENRKFNVVKRGLDYDGTVSIFCLLPETRLVVCTLYTCT